VTVDTHCGGRTALKARLITAMGAAHGIEGPKGIPSRLQSPPEIESQMREYEDEK